MRMLFRTFNGYEDYEKMINKRIGIPNFYHFEESVKDDGLGHKIIHSNEDVLNLFCEPIGEHYHSFQISKHDDWRNIFRECRDFMKDFTTIGCLTICFSDRDEKFIATEYVPTNAYEKKYNDNPFYIIFNARPTGLRSENSIIVGKDHYSLELDTSSVIVWNLDKYSEVNDGSCMLWGFKHDAKNGSSVTGDDLVGIKGDDMEFAISSR